MNKRYKNYLESAEWAKVRGDLLAVYGEQCQICGKETKHLQIHHLSYKNIYHEEPEDLIILCAKCHMKEHGIVKVAKDYSKDIKKPEYYDGSLNSIHEIKSILSHSFPNWRFSECRSLKHVYNSYRAMEGKEKHKRIKGIKKQSLFIRNRCRELLKLYYMCR